MSDEEKQNPFPATPKGESNTNPGMAIAELKYQAKKAVRGNKVNLGLILTALGLGGGFAGYILNRAEAAGQERVVPVQKQVDAQDAAFDRHVTGSDATHRDFTIKVDRVIENQHEFKLEIVRMGVMLERVSERFNVPVPPRADGGP